MSKASLIVTVLALGTALFAVPRPVLAQQNEGIAVGEPSPAGGDLRKDQACPKGQRRFQTYRCAESAEKAPADCPNFSPVLICGKRPAKPRCEKPLKAVPVFHCEGRR